MPQSSAVTARLWPIDQPGEARLRRDAPRRSVAISQAQKALGTIRLDDCEIYANSEPCVFCCYAIRETRMRRVVYGLSSPHMGGVSKWNVGR